VLTGDGRRGRVLKRDGVRLRVEFAEKAAWIKVSDVASVVADDADDGAAAADADLFKLIDRNQNHMIEPSEFIAHVLPQLSDHRRVTEMWAELAGATGDGSAIAVTEASFRRWADQLAPDDLAALNRQWSPLQAGGGGGGGPSSVAPQYTPSERLLVVPADGAPLAEADASAVDPLPHAHCRLRLESVGAYRAAIGDYCADLQSRTAVLEDGITGMRLRTVDQILEIGVSAKGLAHEGISDAPNIAALCSPLLAASSPPPPVLVCAEPGTGKTWSSVQLTHALARQCQEEAASGAPLPLVPVLVYVQRLSRMLEGCDPAKPLDARTLLQYLVVEYGERIEWLSMLTMALELRSLVVVIDGIDEAPDARRPSRPLCAVRSHPRASASCAPAVPRA
jgi:hypothetical protein